MFLRIASVLVALLAPLAVSGQQIRGSGPNLPSCGTDGGLFLRTGEVDPGLYTCTSNNTWTWIRDVTRAVHFHATDCTSLTAGIQADLCVEEDSNNLYSCQPSSGKCDTPSEWVLTGDGSGGSPGVDSVGTSELDDDADTPGSGDYVRVDTVDQAGIEYRTPAEARTDIGADDASNLSLGTVPAARVGGDHVDTLTEIAQGIKTAANDTDPLAVFTGGNPVSNVCVEINSSGQLVSAGDTCANLGPGGSGSLTVEEADLTPSVSSVDTIQFDQADGFTVTDETGGQVQIDLVNAPDSAVSDAITLTNLTQVTNRAIGDTTGDLAPSRVDDGGVASTQALFSGAASAASFRAIVESDISDLSHTTDTDTHVDIEENDVSVQLDPTTLDFLGADFDLSAASGEVEISVAAALTRDAEIDTFAELDSLVSDEALVNTDDAQTLSSKTLDGGVATTTHAAGANVFQVLRHATDCTAITDGVDGEVCWESDANRFFVCETGDGACDTPGEWTQDTDDTGAGGGIDSIEVEDGDDAGTFTPIDTTARFEDQGDINFTFADGGAGGPDSITATVRPDSVALTTDTTGNYVASVADGTGIDGTASGEGATYTPTLDLTEINSVTWGDNSLATIQLTFDPSGATQNPRLDASDETLNLVATNVQANGSAVLTSEANDLETDDPPNVLDNEVYVGTGAGAGSWTALSTNVALSFDGSTFSQASFSQVSGTVGDNQIAAGAVDGGAGGEIADGSITSDDLETDLRDLYINYDLETPATADDGKLHQQVPDACTLQEVECNVDAATSVTINLYERARATPETGTTGMLTSDLVCDTDGANTTSFADSALAKDVPLALGITAVSGTPGWVRVHVKCRR